MTTSYGSHIYRRIRSSAPGLPAAPMSQSRRLNENKKRWDFARSGGDAQPGAERHHLIVNTAERPEDRFAAAAKPH